MIMTVDDVIREFQKLSAEGKGTCPVVWQSLTHTWDIEPRDTTRNGRPVILVNP